MYLADPRLLRSNCFIDGRWETADDGRVLAVTNPANGELLGEVPMLGRAETLRAIDAANAAWESWRETTAKDRALLLGRWFDLIIANTDDLARLITAECGKPLAEASQGNKNSSSTISENPAARTGSSQVNCTRRSRKWECARCSR